MKSKVLLAVAAALSLGACVAPTWIMISNMVPATSIAEAAHEKRRNLVLFP